jgi:hypothetical protein
MLFATSRQVVVLLAESEDMPVVKKVLMLGFFGVVAVCATFCLFASNETLGKWSGFIGTRNPLVARIVCALSALLGWGVVTAVGASFVFHFF